MVSSGSRDMFQSKRRNVLLFFLDLRSPLSFNTKGKELWGFVVNEAFSQGFLVIAKDAVGGRGGWTY